MKLALLAVGTFSTIKTKTWYLTTRDTFVVAHVYHAIDFAVSAELIALSWIVVGRLLDSAGFALAAGDFRHVIFLAPLAAERLPGLVSKGRA
jgi:hypothetical protein